MSELTGACFQIDPSCQLGLLGTVGRIDLQSGNGGKPEVRLSVKAAKFPIRQEETLPLFGEWVSKFNLNMESY